MTFRKTAFEGLITAQVCLAMLYMGTTNADAQQAAPQSSSGNTAASVNPLPNELVVTARRREEKLMDVPVTLSVMTNEKIAHLNVKSLSDLQAYTPGLYTQENSSGRVDRTFDQIIIRGIADPLNPTVSVFLDGAPVGPDLVQQLGGDISRVEVLKGPQNAAFGRQAFAGAINIVTRDPGNEWKGYVDAGLGSYATYQLAASLEFPIVRDMLSARISGRVSGTEGQYLNSADPNMHLGLQRTQTASATVVFKPAENLRLKGFFNWLNDNDNPGASAMASPSPTNLFTCNAGAAAAGVNNFFCGAVPAYPLSQLGQNSTPTPAFISTVINGNFTPGPIYKPFNYTAGMKRHEITSNLVIDYTIPGSEIVLSSLTAYNHTRWDVNQDLDGRDTTAYGTNTPDMVLDDESYVSQELRITSGSHQPFRWMAGGNFYQARNKSYVAALYSGFPVLFVDGSLNVLTDKSIFASASWDFLNKFTLNVEGRYFNEILHLYNRTTGVDTTGSYNRFAPRVSLQYRPESGLMTYATYSRGVNKGGFNLGVGVPAQYLLYRPSTLDNFEVGFKGNIGRRLTVTAAAFYGLWNNQVFNSYVPNTVPPISYQANIAASHVRGAEMEATYKASDHLTFNLSAGYALTTLSRSVYCIQCSTITGLTNLPVGAINPAAPQFTSALGGEYTAQLTDTLKWFARVDWTHRSRIYLTYENQSWLSDANKVNVRVGINNKTIEAQAYVNNLLNELSYSGVSVENSVLVGGNGVVLSMPVKREVGVRVRYNF